VSNNPQKLRLDQLLVARGLATSREKAQRLIMAGHVRVDSQPSGKAGQLLPEDAQIEVLGQEKYVGRGGLKLEGALAEFVVNPAGRVCLDVGASTGGFTDCLLQAGATRVYAIDVGHNQIDWRLRQDPRVVVREGVNARHLGPEDVAEPVSLLVADVSFISLTLVLPPAFNYLVPGGDAIVLIKPQFELERNQVGRGGIVRDDDLRQKAVDRIRTFAAAARIRWLNVMDSPIAGAKGNREFLAHLQK